MKDPAFFCRRDEPPLDRGQWIDIHFRGNRDSIDAKSGQYAIGPGLFREQIFAEIRIDFTVNGEVEVARHAGGENRAIAVDKMQAAPHRSASGPDNLPDPSRFFLDAIGVFGRRINTQIEPLPIKRRGFE